LVEITNRGEIERYGHVTLPIALICLYIKGKKVKSTLKKAKAWLLIRTEHLIAGLVLRKQEKDFRTK
jgi:hypothetical protein